MNSNFMRLVFALSLVFCIMLGSVPGALAYWRDGHRRNHYVYGPRHVYRSRIYGPRYVYRPYRPHWHWVWVTRMAPVTVLRGGFPVTEVRPVRVKVRVFN